MAVLIITNVIKDQLDVAIAGLLSAATKLEAKCDVMLIGDKLVQSLDKLATYTNINQILCLEDNSFTNLIVDNIINTLTTIVSNYSHVLLDANSFGINLLPKLAGSLGIGQISEVVDIVSASLFKRVTYSGSILLEIESLEALKLLTIRSNRFDSNNLITTATANNIAITRLNYTPPSHSKIKFINNTVTNATVSLANAKVVVSGGKSLKTKENFDKYIGALANKLKAAVACSRDAVEEGIAPNELQVGQTGKVIAPDVYIAIGISGAIQHIAGMKDAKLVIAINEDESAPIFDYADYGLVADLFVAVPELLTKLEE